MPSKNQHLQKAQHDENFVASLDIHTTPFLDWAVTGLFYAAVHYVEGYLATIGKHSPDHRVRDSAIQRDKKIRGIYDDFNELKNCSINARYYVVPFTPQGLTQNLIPRLNAIKAHILQVI